MYAALPLSIATMLDAKPLDKRRHIADIQYG